ncbi:MAG TPA: response regulator transcription factor, partial [Pseudonocardia sp.]|nr:response regulator transcription factor [Pseudonocardia sp.]
MTLLDQRPVRTQARRTARLLLVDGEAIVRFGLRQLFAADPDLVVVGEAAGPRDALALADRCPPDLVVLDLDLGRDGAGLDLARRLLERHRGVRILVLTGSRDRDLMMRAMRLGVHGFLRKSADTAEVVAAVRSLLRGQGVFDAGPVMVDVLRPDEPR